MTTLTRTDLRVRLLRDCQRGTVRWDPAWRTVAGSEIQQWTEKRETVMNEDRCTYPNCCCNQCNPFLYAERIGVSRTPKVTPRAPALTESVAAPYDWRDDPTATFRFGVFLGASPLILIVIIALLVL